MEPSRPKNGSRRRGGAGGHSRRRRSASPSSTRPDTRRRGPPPHTRSFTDNRRYSPPPPSIPPPPPPPAPAGGFSALSRQRDVDAYRPGQPPSSDYRSSGYPPHPHRQPDNYRPDDFRPPRSDFTFNIQAPPGLLPYPPPREPGGRSRGDGFRGRGRGRGRGPRFSASSRPILTASNDALPHVFLRDENVGAKYKSVDELSDDEEHDMDISDDSNSDAQPAKKRAKVEEPSKASAATPKWSNPDAYTALPPPDPSNRQKKDVVQLIRKARVDIEEAKEKAPVAALDEFISLDASTDEGEGADEPRGADNRASRRAQREEDRRSDPLGSRKRTADDEIKPPPQSFAKKQKPNMELRGTLSSEWLPSAGQDPCPWATIDHSATTEMGAWLHKEVIDFYEHFRPRKFEQAMRQRLVDNLNKGLKRNNQFRNCEVKAFGSFMSGLYLPMADMDLVVCSDQLLKMGWVTQRLTSKSSLYRFRAFLQHEKIPVPDSVQVISGARVPLVKYVDRLTGLRVDVSFENIGGVKAIDRFVSWRRQYPAMPILVTIIKQFLSMRGLNEPVNGGIGGFSVICLVVSMLQLMPQVQSGDMVPEHHLGELLMEFFDLYGNRFEYEDVAIRLNPPGYLHKTDVNSFPYRSLDRLSIIDPNNSSNDVAGSSKNYDCVARGFREAYKALKARLAEVGALGVCERADASLLQAIIGGNYAGFEAQREYLRALCRKATGVADDAPHVY